MKHPTQPLSTDDNGTVRFKENEIVRYLLDHGPFDMNFIASHEFPQEDRIQFAQLIGYSLGGFGELSYVTDDAFAVAHAMANGTTDEKDAKIAYYEELLSSVREKVKPLAVELFNIHQDDLNQ